MKHSKKLFYFISSFVIVFMYAVFHKSAWITLENGEKVLAATCAPYAVLHLE